ncbi:MAG TPA: GNAT family N-acetyltransferase [Acidimicrobiia bacterium]
MEVRTAQAGDLVHLRDVFRRASLSNAGDRELLLAHPEVLEYDDSHVRTGRTRVAVVDGRVVGFASLVFGDGAELEDLFVDPDWMRRGVATALVVDARDVALARGVTRIDVTANEHARAFYEAVGFVEDGTAATPLGPTAPRMRLDLATE